MTGGYMNIVYRHINKTNGKIYVGQTSKTLNERCGLEGYGYLYSNGKTSNNKFANAIRKYGWENFDHEILKENLNDDDADYWENYYINEFDSIKNGYNSISGGKKYKKFSDEVKKKISESQKGKIVSREIIEKAKATYKKHKEEGLIKKKIVSEETRQKISAAKKGKKLSEEHRRKLSESSPRISRPISEEQKAMVSNIVFQFDLNGNFIREFKSAIEAGRMFNNSHIYRAANGSRKTANGSIWIYKKDFSKDLLEEKIRKAKEDKFESRKLKVFQYKLDGTLVKIWDSVNDVKRKYGTSFCKCLKRKRIYCKWLFLVL